MTGAAAGFAVVVEGEAVGDEPACQSVNASTCAGVCADNTSTSAASDRVRSASSSGTTMVAYRANLGGTAAVIVMPTPVAALIHTTSSRSPIRRPRTTGPV
jgi:hypothetical protein